MKKITVLLILFTCLTSISYAQKAKQEKKKETVQIRLDEMCNNCVNKINRYIAFEKGITALDINQEERVVNVTYTTNKTDTTKLRKAFSKVKLNIEEMKILSDEYENSNDSK